MTAGQRHKLASEEKRISYSNLTVILATLCAAGLMVAQCSADGSGSLSRAEPPSPTSSSSSIRLTNFRVPAQAKLSSSVQLVCEPNISGGQLHAIKWFKDEKEFYRFTPQSSVGGSGGHKQAFPFAGITVDLNRSSEGAPVLRNLTLASAGLYECKVILEDSFRSISQRRKMEVNPSAGGHRSQLTRGANQQQAVGRRQSLMGMEQTQGRGNGPRDLTMAMSSGSESLAATLKRPTVALICAATVLWLASVSHFRLALLGQR